MTENKKKQNADEIARTNLDGIIRDVIPVFDRYAESVFTKLQDALSKTENASEIGRAIAVPHVRELLNEYLPYISFIYFAGLFSHLMDSIESIKDALPEAQKEKLKGMEQEVTKGKESIDDHIAKRLGELFGKDGAGYIS